MNEVVEVIPEGSLGERVRSLGEAISADYEGRVPVLVGVLAGCLPFLSDLSRAIAGDCEIEFLSLNRFGEGGRARISMDTEISLEGRDVLIVEDIVDTGLSLTFLRRLLETRDLESLRTVALLDKVPRRIVDVPIEYRDPKEVLWFRGKDVYPAGTDAFYPAFDLTPKRYVTALITFEKILNPADLPVGWAMRDETACSSRRRHS